MTSTVRSKWRGQRGDRLGDDGDTQTTATSVMRGEVSPTSCWTCGSSPASWKGPRTIQDIAERRFAECTMSLWSRRSPTLTRSREDSGFSAGRATSRFRSEVDPPFPVVGIDHGASLLSGPKLRTVLWGWAGQGLTPQDRGRLDRLDAALPPL